MTTDEASRLAIAAGRVARLLDRDWRDGRRPREGTYFSAEPRGPDGPWTIALGIEAIGAEDVVFFTFGLSCIRLPPGDGADQLLALFTFLGSDAADVARATGQAPVSRQASPAPAPTQGGARVRSIPGTRRGRDPASSPSRRRARPARRARSADRRAHRDGRRHARRARCVEADAAL